jgi:hypothetical protein
MMKEDRKETKTLLIALAVIAILCGGFLIWIRIAKEKPPSYPTYEYNGFTFTQIEGLWHTEWQRGNDLYGVHLRYGPRESEDVPIERLSEGYFTINDSVYLTFDPGAELGHLAVASAELSLSLFKTFGLQPIAACTKNETVPCSKRPIITCQNTDEKVIYLRNADTAKVIINDNCMIIQGNKEDLVRAADKVIWTWYGIIK